MSTTKQLGGSLKEQIYSQVFESIIQGEYKPNDVLSEKSLVEKYNVSKSPVREALIELCNEGILRSIPRYGYEVIRITDREVTEIQEYRLILECCCLNKYWDNITQKDIEHLQSVLDKDYCNDKECDLLEHWSRNSRFHLALMSSYNNEYMYRNLKSALRFLSRAYAQFFWDKWHQTVFFSTAGSHKKILECIRKNDKEQALKYLEQDISGFDGEESGLRPFAYSSVR